VTTVGLAVLGALSNGCSLLYTKGPEPMMRPPPPCTTSNEAPITDTVLAGVSVGMAVAGAIIAHNTSNCGGAWCGLNNGFTGDGLLILGSIGALLFIPSAGVGYGRTAACRDWLEENPQYAPPVRPGRPQGRSWLLVPAPECSSRGDAPLLCASGVAAGAATAAEDNAP
jgi:hypothetical protein